MEIKIREMIVEDASAVTALSHQLGYPLSHDEIAVNIQAVINSNDHTAFVAEYENKVIGWIGCTQAILVEIKPQCEITGLIIDKEFQRKGIGKFLIEKVKQWAKEKGNKKLSLRCNVKRVEAHQFYLHLGFRDIKKQTNFVLDI